MNEIKWYPFYTKSRYEKKVYIELLKQHYEAYLPLQKTIRQWKDRKKIVEVPLFSSYIFVKIAPRQIIDVLRINGIARYISFNNKLAYVKDEEIDLIKSFLETNSKIEVVDGLIKEDSEVVMKSGLFSGYKGKIIKHCRKNKIVVEIESMNKTLLVTLDTESIKE